MIKKVLIALAFVIGFSTIASAAPATCESIGDAAAVVMTAKQKGVPLHKVIALAKGNKFFEMIAIDAYDSPNYNTEEIKQRQITKFRAKWELACFKSRL